MSSVEVARGTIGGACMLFIGWFSATTTAQPGVQETPADYRRFSHGATVAQSMLEKPLVEQLFSAVGQWSQAPSQDGATRCQELAMQLIRTGDASTDAYYYSAQVLELVGQTRESMGVLEEILQKRPDGASPGRFHSRVQNSANFWLGRLALDLGDLPRASQAFAEARRPIDNYKCEGLCGLTSLTHELQAASLQATGNTGKPTISEDVLRQQYVVPAEQLTKGSGEYCTMMVDWLAKAGLIGDNNPGAPRIAPAVGEFEMGMFIYGYLDSLGITLDGSQEVVRHWAGDNVNGKVGSILSVYLKEAKSKLDRVILLMALAKAAFCEADESNATARQTTTLETSIKIYQQVLAEDPFFAPWAQLGITDCLARMGKKAEAFHALDEIAAAWPTYASIVGQTKDFVEHPETAQLPPSLTPSQRTPVRAPVPQLVAMNTYTLLLAGAGVVLALVLLGLRLWSWRKAISTKQQ